VSSSLLYVAIVAVWAFVLVPRWLRRQHAQPQSPADVEDEYPAEYDAGMQYYCDDDQGAPSGEADLGGPVPFNGLAVQRAPLSRSRVLRARRRLLTTLLMLTAVAVACTAVKVTSWWVGVPPAVLLGMYVLLLREAALADAEQARRRASMQARVRAARRRAYAEEMAREAEPSAQIIDISARVADQLYDQYADATVRAVGD